MNWNGLPVMLFNIWLVINVIFFEVDAQFIVVFIFLELLVYGIFRFFRITKFVEKNVAMINPLSYTSIIFSGAVFILSVIVMFIGLDSSASKNNLPSVITIIRQNIFLVLYICLAEIINALKYYFSQNTPDYSFYFVYAKLLVIVLSWLVLNILIFFKTSNMAQIIFCLACIIGKSLVDYWITILPNSSNKI